MARASGVVFIGRDHLQYGGNGTKDVLALKMPDKLTVDMEVVDKPSFVTYLISFIDKYQLSGQTVAIVMAEESCFSQEIPKETPEAQKVELLKDFSATVPFELVQVKRFVKDDGEKFVGVNRRMYEAVSQAFEQKGFAIENVYPASEVGVGVGNSMDGKIMKTILGAIDKAEGFEGNGANNDLGEVKEEAGVSKKVENDASKAKGSFWKKNKKVAILLPVFLLGIIILVVLILVRFNNPT